MQASLAVTTVGVVRPPPRQWRGRAKKSRRTTTKSERRDFFAPSPLELVVDWSVLPNGDKAPTRRSDYVDWGSPLLPEKEWRLKAVCRGKSVSPATIAPWYPGPGGAHGGKVYCAVCPVARECNAFANDNDIEWGIWGGQIRHRLKKSETE